MTSVSFPYIFAHGTSGRGDLPIPFWLFSYQAILVLVGSVVLLAFFWKTAKLENKSLGHQIQSRGIHRLASITNFLLRTASLAIFLVVFFAALFGELGAKTVAPVSIYIIFWVGLVLLSALLGDMWRILSPWDTLAIIGVYLKGIFRNPNRHLNRHKPRQESQIKIIPPSQAATSWIAVFGLFVFVWLELVHPYPDETRLLGMLILIYTLYLLVGAGLWGRGWLKQADSFAILHRLIGSMGIFSRKSIRPPLMGTTQLKLKPPETVFLLVLLGSTTFDGITNTDWWEDLQDTSGWASVPQNSLGLIITITAVGLAYYLAMFMTARLTGSDPIKLACDFAHSLVPIALAYSVAHYFSLLLFEGQDFVSLLSDPLQQGWDLFNTAHFRINYRLISTDLIAWVQALSILIGHLWGVFLAHERALAIWKDDYKTATKSQYPLVVVMLGYTLLGLYLLLNA